jgi:hypothetical protein
MLLFPAVNTPRFNPFVRLTVCHQLVLGGLSLTIALLVTLVLLELGV